MSAIENSRNGNGPTPTVVSEPVERQADQPATSPSAAANAAPETSLRFATRTDAKPTEGVNKGKMLLLAGGLTIAVLFFVFTSVVGKSPKMPTTQAKQQSAQTPKGSVTH